MPRKCGAFFKSLIILYTSKKIIGKKFADFMKLFSISILNIVIF